MEDGSSKEELLKRLPAPHIWRLGLVQLNAVHVCLLYIVNCNDAYRPPSIGCSLVVLICSCRSVSAVPQLGQLPIKKTPIFNNCWSQKDMGWNYGKIGCLLGTEHLERNNLGPKKTISKCETCCLFFQKSYCLILFVVTFVVVWLLFFKKEPRVTTRSAEARSNSPRCRPWGRWRRPRHRRWRGHHRSPSRCRHLAAVGPAQYWWVKDEFVWDVWLIYDKKWWNMMKPWKTFVDIGNSDLMGKQKDAEIRSFATCSSSLKLQDDQWEVCLKLTAQAPKVAMVSSSPEQPMTFETWTANARCKWLLGSMGLSVNETELRKLWLGYKLWIQGHSLGCFDCQKNIRPMIQDDPGVDGKVVVFNLKQYLGLYSLGSSTDRTCWLPPMRTTAPTWIRAKAVPATVWHSIEVINIQRKLSWKTVLGVWHLQKFTNKKKEKDTCNGWKQPTY